MMGTRHTFRFCLTTVAGVAGAFGLLFPNVAGSQEAEDFVVTAPAPACTPDQILAWSDAKDTSLGVAGRDPIGETIGCWPRPPFYNFSPAKQTLCGVLDNYFFYEAWGDEADWNNNTIPAPDYSYLIDEPQALGINPHAPCGGFECMQAEITPDNNYYGDPWFPEAALADELSPLEGNGTTLCSYGPWAGDFGHGGRPEIHPSELLWWRWEGSTYLLLLQDDSNRFDRPDDFSEPLGCPGPKPSWWRPWAKFPRTGEFRVAFSKDPEGERSSLRIVVDDARHVQPDESDATDGISHRLVYDGRTLLTVVEFGDDGNVQVGFEDVCLLSGSFGGGGVNQLIGFVTLTSLVGEGDRGDEGFQLLRLVEGGSDDVGIPESPPRSQVALAGSLLADSLGLVEGQLLADLDVTVLPGPGATDSDLRIAGISGRC